MNKKNVKICLVASAGGHLSQLLKVKDAWKDSDIFYVSTLDSARKKINDSKPIYITGECNRQHPIESFKVLIRCIKVIHLEKPDVIITTGAAPGCLLCLAGKISGAKVIWLDSIANVERLSLSGRIIKPFADMILSQWAEVARKYKKVEYAGAVV